MRKFPCCLLDDLGRECGKDAEWGLHYNGNQLEETYACHEHVREFLSIDANTTVWYIGEKQSRIIIAGGK